MEVISLKDKYDKFTDHWSPRIIEETNGQQVKIAKVQGDFVWHEHEDEDELFYVVKGHLTIELEDRTLELKEGDLTVIPKGVRHCPKAKNETWILLIEPGSTKHTGSEDYRITNNNQERI